MPKRNLERKLGSHREDQAIYKMLHDGKRMDRGRSLVYITLKTFTKLLGAVETIERVGRYGKTDETVYALKQGYYFNKHLKDLELQCSPKTVRRHLQAGVESLHLYTGGRSISFDSVKNSGRIMRYARRYQMSDQDLARRYSHLLIL